MFPTLAGRFLTTGPLGKSLFLKKKIIYLAASDLSWGTSDLHFCMWGLVLWPGIEPVPPALGVQGLSHWPTREVSECVTFRKHSTVCQECTDFASLSTLATSELVLV